MSVQEISHRIIEQLKKSTSSIYSPNFSENDTDIPILPRIQSGLSALTENKWLLDEWNIVTDRANSHKYSLLGMEWPQAEVDNYWMLDPMSGKQWPASEYCFNISYRHRSDMGDVKYVWELNRLQFLQPIASLAYTNSDQLLTQFCTTEIESWIDNNPPYNGINWVSGIELASRIVSILVVTSLIGKEAFTATQRKKIATTLAAHGYWLARFPSKFSSANNHLIAEAAGLFLLGNLAPWLASSKQWADYGRTILLRETSKQILTDGVGAEQSPTYLAYSLEWLLICAHVANEIGSPFPPAFWQRIESAGEYLHWITDSTGNQPRIGDDDEGRVIYSQDSPEDYVSSILGCLSSITGRYDLAPPQIKPHLREAIFGKATANTTLPSGSKCFKAGGYSIYRGESNNKDLLLAFDHGPLGYLSIAAHGHADALSVWLHIDGKPVLVDAGTFLYHSGKDWRDYMRGTAAHNTLSINETDSSRISGAFNWAGKAKTKLISFKETEYGMIVKAEHDGYLGNFGVLHQRELEISNDSITITDQLIGDCTAVPVEINFLFHPSLNITTSETSWAINDVDDSILDVCCHESQFKGNIKIGNSTSKTGWYSPAFGHKIPAPQLSFKGELSSGDTCRITLILASRSL